MIRLSIFVPPERCDEVRRVLAATPGVVHVVAGASTEDGLVSVVAQIEPDAADAVVDALSGFELPWQDVTFWRVPSIHPLGWRRGHAKTDPDWQLWAEVVSRADSNSQLLVSYVVFMIAAGVVAAVGVLTGSSILVVGAMALSPDLLPISASAIGIVERRWRLVARAMRALTIGLAIGAAASCAATAFLRAFGRVPGDLVLAETVLGPSLTHLGPGSMLVAVAAGVSGMSRSSAPEPAPWGSPSRSPPSRGRVRRRRDRARPGRTDVGCAPRADDERRTDHPVEHRDAGGAAQAPGRSQPLDLSPDNLTPTAPVQDITYIPSGEGWLYVASVLDLGSRRLLGYSMADHMRTELVLDALGMAVAARGGTIAGTIAHADRGSLYTSNDYLEFCHAHQLRPSVGRTGVCWDCDDAGVLLRSA